MIQPFTLRPYTMFNRFRPETELLVDPALAAPELRRLRGLIVALNGKPTAEGYHLQPLKAGKVALLFAAGFRYTPTWNRHGFRRPQDSVRLQMSDAVAAAILTTSPAKLAA